jgi:hypothetical protein
MPKPLAELRDHYPTASDMRKTSLIGGRDARLAIARLWLSEGIPFAFRESPGIYEAVRMWVAVMLGIYPKEITMIGSARLGQSLSDDNFGRPFSDQSDMDLTIVSEDYFEKMRTEFCKWALQYESGEVSPQNDRERRFWDDHLKRGPKLISKGFLDSHMIPLRNAYPVAQNVGQTMYLLKEKLKATEEAPHVLKVDARVYRRWDAFARQMDLSLSRMQDALHPR